jgi:hypothetical protein
VLGSELETRIGVEPVFAHGGMDAQALRFEGDIGHRTLGIDKADQSHAGPGGTGCPIDEPLFGGGVRSIPKPPAAVLACELARLSWPAIHLGELNRVEYFWCETAMAEL